MNTNEERLVELEIRDLDRLDVADPVGDLNRYHVMQRFAQQVTLVTFVVWAQRAGRHGLEVPGLAACSSRYLCASRAAMQPLPALVTA